jgi:hypothetical protein
VEHPFALRSIQRPILQRTLQLPLDALPEDLEVFPEKARIAANRCGQVEAQNGVVEGMPEEKQRGQ